MLVHVDLLRKRLKYVIGQYRDGMHVLGNERETRESPDTKDNNSEKKCLKFLSRKTNKKEYRQ